MSHDFIGWFNLLMGALILSSALRAAGRHVRRFNLATGAALALFGASRLAAPPRAAEIAVLLVVAALLVVATVSLVLAFRTREIVRKRT